MKIRMAQLVVEKNIQENLEKVERVLADAQSEEWVIFPEGIISGYYPEKDTFTSNLNQQEIDEAITKIKEVVKEKNVTCLIGSAMHYADRWYNCTILLSPQEKIMYKKNNLSTLDRHHFVEGNAITTFSVNEVQFGIQMCRELVFPEQWKLLRQEGAQIIFHINNSIKEGDQVREHILIARAFENQVWICSVNNAAYPQTMRSLLIDPLGNIIWQSTPQNEEIFTADIDLTKNSDVYLTQARTDLMKVVRS